jgi:hypothetical protein
MTRIISDRTGSYDLARVAAITQASQTVRDPNTGGTLPVKLAILHLDGGQVIHTEQPYLDTLNLWHAVKAQEDEFEAARAMMHTEIYRNAVTAVAAQPATSKNNSKT